MNTKYIFLICAVSTTLTLNATIELGMPYRAAFFSGEPRFATSDLLSLEMRIAGSVGKPGHAYSPDAEKHRSVQGVSLCVEDNLSANSFLSGMFLMDRIQDRRYPHLLYTKEHRGFFSFSLGVMESFCPSAHFDFLDCSGEVGMLLPVFCHDAPPAGAVRGACACGIFDWITAGFSGDILLFAQDGGAQFHFNGFLKADHFVRGFSLLGGLTYNKQGGSGSGADGYACLPSWSMVTLNLMLSYDLAEESHPSLPTITWFYNRVLSGRGCFNRIHIMGLSFGVEF